MHTAFFDWLTTILTSAITSAILFLALIFCEVANFPIVTYLYDSFSVRYLHGLSIVNARTCIYSHPITPLYFLPPIQYPPPHLTTQHCPSLQFILTQLT